MRVKLKKAAVKVLTLMLTIFMLMGGISSISPAAAKEIKTENNTATFSATPTAGVTSKNLSQIEKNSFASEEKVFYAAGGNDLSEKVSFKTTAFIDGKKLTDKCDIQSTVGSPYSYEFEWKYIGNEKEITEGSFFSVEIFKIPGLNIQPLKDQLAIIKIENRSIRIGTWDLTYDNDGILRFTMYFSKYASSFTDLQGFKEGSGKLTDKSDGEIIIYSSVNSYTGRIDTKPKSNDNNQPGINPLPGNGWEITAPPNFGFGYYNFGKGIKWNNSDSSNPVGQIEWRAVYVDYMQDIQKKYLNDNTSILGDDGKGSILENTLDNIKTDSLTVTDGCYILEDTLDPNQRFAVPKNDTKYKEAPFFLELPVMYPGTNNLLPGYSFGNGNYDGSGNAGVDIGGDIFTKIDENYADLNGNTPENYVNENAMTWTIIKVTGKDGLQRDKLIINFGKLGVKKSSNEKGITFNDNTLKIINTAIDKQIKQAQDSMNALKSGSNSPASELKAKTDALKTYLNSNNLLDEVSKNAFDAFDEWYTENFTQNNKENLLSSLDATMLNKLNSTNISGILTELTGSNTALASAKVYVDWKKHYENLNKNQQFYADNRISYIDKWDYALGRYQLTKEFYKDGQVYGFCLKYNTEVVNNSVDKFSNNISIKTQDIMLKSEDTATIKFKHGISGNFSLGSAVFKKADASYGDYTNVGSNGLEGAEFEVYCASRKSANGLRSLFETTDENLWELVQDEEHLGCFAAPSASSGGKAYVWSHHKKGDTGDNTGIAPDTECFTRVVTDNEGTLALEGLKSSEPHYLVEKKAPDGYYLNSTPIMFQTNSDNIFYDFVPNTVRAVKLTKASSYDGKAVEGAEFELYKASDNNSDRYIRITGFTDTTFTGSDGTKTRFYQYNYNTDSAAASSPLKTFAGGELNIHGLPEGKYYLKEVKAADGYVLTDAQTNKKYHFTLEDEMTEKLKNSLYNQNGFSYVLANPDTNSSKIEPKAVENDEVTKAITFTKVGKEDKALAGAAFTLLKWTGTEEQYMNNSENHEHWESVNMNDSDSPYFKTQNKGYSKIEKTGYDGYLTDTNGKITFTNLPDGHYAIKEVKAPDSYELLNHMLYFDVNIADSSDPQLYWNTGNNNPIASNNVPNVLLPGSLKVHKLVVGNNADLSKQFDFTITLGDENGKPLSGTYNYTITRQTNKSEGKADAGDRITQETGTLQLNSNGQYNFKLTHEDALTVTGLPAGAHYSVKEAEYSDYALTMLNSSGHIASGEVVTVTAQNRYKTGLLRLTKNTTGINAEKDRAFEFTLSLKDNANTPLKGDFSYKGTAVPGTEAPADGVMNFDTNGIAKISLKSGQHITLYGLPAGVNYTITETPTDNYTVKITTDVLNTEENSGNIDALSETSAIDGNSVSGTISDNKRNDIDFNNISTPDPGELMISKTIECLSIDMNKEFTFDIELKDINGAAVIGGFSSEVKYRDKIDYSSKTNNESKKTSLIKDEIKFDQNGQASVVLKHDEFITIKNLPADVTYKVTERESPGYVSSLKDAAAGTISEETPSIVAVTNYHREGNLIVSKQMDGRGGDFNQEFTFDIKLNDADGNPLNGNYNYAGSSISSDVTAPDSDILEIRNGKGSFKLKHGQRIIISGLPEGTNYNISEDLSALGDDLKDRYVADSIDSSGTIENRVESNARFVNRFRTGELRVIKNVVDGDYDKNFNFTVALNDKNINGIYNEMEFRNGVAEFTLKHGESKIATGLPAGVNYVVTEEPYEDYIVSSINAEGSIKDETIARAEFNNTKKELPPDPGEGGDNPGGSTDPDNPGSGTDPNNPGGGIGSDNPSGITDPDHPNNGNNFGNPVNESENRNNSIKTGDTFSPWLLTMLTTISAIGIISAMLYRRKTKH